MDNESTTYTSSSCPEGYSNVDELDMLNITDCSIKKGNVKVMYTLAITTASILLLVSAAKLSPLVKAHQFKRDNVQHLIVLTGLCQGIANVTLFSYKLAVYAPTSDLDPTGLLLEAAFSGVFFQSVVWLFVFYIMSVSTQEIGRKGVELSKKFQGIAVWMAATGILGHNIPYLVMYLDPGLRRPMSFCVTFNMFYGAATTIVTLRMFYLKADTLISQVIESWTGDASKDAVSKRLAKNKKNLGRAASVVTQQMGPPALIVTGGSFLSLPFFAGNSWVVQNGLHTVSSIASTAVVYFISIPVVDHVKAKKAPVFKRTEVTSIQTTQVIKQGSQGGPPTTTSSSTIETSAAAGGGVGVGAKHDMSSVLPSPSQ